MGWSSGNTKSWSSDDSTGNMHKYVKSTHMKRILSGWTFTKFLNFYLFEEKSILKAEYETQLLWCDKTDVFCWTGTWRTGLLVWIQHPAAPAEILTGHLHWGTPSCHCVLSTWIRIGLLMKRQHAHSINLLLGCIKVKKQRKGIIYSANRAAGIRRKVKNHMSHLQ